MACAADILKDVRVITLITMWQHRVAVKSVSHEIRPARCGINYFYILASCVLCKGPLSGLSQIRTPSQCWRFGRHARHVTGCSVTLRCRHSGASRCTVTLRTGDGDLAVPQQWQGSYRYTVLSKENLSSVIFDALSVF